MGRQQRGSREGRDCGDRTAWTEICSCQTVRIVVKNVDAEGEIAFIMASVYTDNSEK